MHLSEFTRWFARSAGLNFEDGTDHPLDLTKTIYQRLFYMSITFRESDILEAVEVALSPKRLITYVMATSGDRKSALQLHAWNTAVSAAFYGPLQGLEITLRNAMNRQLVRKYGEEWYDDNSHAELDQYACRQVALTKNRLERCYSSAEAAQVVANLSFGFWVSLVGSGGKRGENCRANYERTLWRPALRQAFRYPKPLLRKEVHKKLVRLRDLRNRVAHHEPIFARDLEKDHQDILELTDLICPETAEWIKQNSRALELLRFRKDPDKIRF